MKKCICLLVILLNCYFVHSQEPEIVKNDRLEDEIKEVVRCDLSADKLYSNANSMLAIVYNSFKKEFVDDENKTIIATGVFYLGNHTGDEAYSYYHKEGCVEFKLKLECKDNRFRYIITNIKIIELKKQYSKVSWGDFFLAYGAYGLDGALYSLSAQQSINNRNPSKSYSLIGISNLKEKYLADSIRAKEYSDEFNRLLREKNVATSKKEESTLLRQMSAIGNVKLRASQEFYESRDNYNLGTYVLKILVHTIKNEMVKDDDF